MKRFPAGNADRPREIPPGAAWPLARLVRGYWEALRDSGGGALPRRSTIDPRTIAPALHSVFLAGRVAMGLVRIRIGGTTLANLAGIEVMDMPLSVLFVPESRPQLALAVEHVLRDGAIATLDLAAERAAGRPELAARLVMAPLMAMDGASTIMLGCLECDRPVGRLSRRFAILRSRIEAGAAPDIPAPVPARTRMPVPAPAGPPVPAPATLSAPPPAPSRQATGPATGPATGQEPPGRRRPAHLRLVHSV